MIFVAAKEEPTLFVMLTVSDMQTMLGGRTLFVDGKQFADKETLKSILAGYFNKVIISCHKTQDDILRDLRAAGKEVPANLFQHTPQPTQLVCAGCKGHMLPHTILGGKCIACWKQQAETLTAQSN